MKQHTIQTALTFVLLASSAVHAQQTAQWKVSDGGNGHWYGKLVGSYQFSYQALNTAAANRGGHLLSLVSRAEEEFVLAVWGTTFLGLQSPPGSGNFEWSSGEPVTYSNWGTSACFSGPYPNNGSGAERFVYQSHPECAGSQGFAPAWDDYYQSDLGTYIVDPVIEFDADCNSDGIVDYGQCHDGTLPDYNGNNIPDCCERGEACVVGRYPVQWRDDDGGNGHWYGVLGIDPSRSPEEHFALAAARGGHTGTISSTAENAHCFRVMAGTGAVIGLRKQADTNIPEWITGEPMTFLNWYPGEGGNYWERYAALPSAWGGGWLDTDLTERNFSLVEWDADCNNDNIVDYGQILDGQLTDANTNGIPDICEGPTCHDIDLNLNGIVDGADLGVLLAFWGTVSPAFPRADINGDGLVNGADLGIVLAFWGPCTN
jgi:hypothetical protein